MNMAELSMYGNNVHVQDHDHGLRAQLLGSVHRQPTLSSLWFENAIVITQMVVMVHTMLSEDETLIERKALNISLRSSRMK